MANIDRRDVELLARLVHSACIVYMPLPSPSRQMHLAVRTGDGGTDRDRPAEADRAAHVVDRVVRRRARGERIVSRPVVIDSSTTMAFSGINAASAGAIDAGVSAPVGSWRRRGSAAGSRFARQRRGQRLERG